MDLIWGHGHPQTVAYTRVVPVLSIDSARSLSVKPTSSHTLLSDWSVYLVAQPAYCDHTQVAPPSVAVATPVSSALASVPMLLVLSPVVAAAPDGVSSSCQGLHEPL